jgi:uncharacterized protein (TIGR01370 family)
VQLKLNKKIALVILVMFAWLQPFSSVRASEDLSPWMVYYGTELPSRAFSPYKLVVLDSANHALVAPLIDKEKTVLAYLSLGEVEQHRPWFTSVEAEGLLLSENKNWPGSFFVDLRDMRWASRVIEELIPAMLRRGFQGVFLDTLDNPADLERQDPKKYQGMTDAAVRLVLTIRRHYPEIKIMMNRGYELLPHVGQAIDMELGESVFSDYDFTDKSYGLVDSRLYQRQVSLLQDAAKKFPDLKIYTLDYWVSKDKKGIARIYQQQRKNGFIPLVSTIGLDEILPVPQIVEAE